jgi:hypothetical protein
MEIVIKAPVKNIVNKEEDNSIFLKEFAEGYLWAEKDKHNTELNEYLEAYHNIEDKNSFNAQYLESIIYMLEK